MTFNKFKGISKEREVIVREKAALEFLLDACDRVVNEYKTKISDRQDKAEKVYPDIYTKLEKELPEYNEQDLTSLIFAKANNAYDNKESQALGLYTGVLLHLLTERNNAKGKGTRYYINGQGNKFDYLFSYAKEVDELIIDSFTGDFICGHIASYAGKANKIVLNNNKGNGIAWSIGRTRGDINIVIINNNKGNYAASNAGSSEGNIKTLIINNSTGNLMAWEAGCNEGDINTIILINNEGDRIAWYAGYTGNVNKIIQYNNKTRVAEDAKAKPIILGEKALQEYKEIIEILTSFKDKTPEELITAAEQIEACLKI